MNYLFGLVSLLFFSGCVGPQVVNLTKTFNVEQAKFIQTKGNNTLKGNAFLRQNGGGVVTCAGSNVDLIPVTDYSNERISRIYFNNEKGFSQNSLTFTPDSPDYRVYMRHTMCDSQGIFKFDNVADGEYFVTTIVQWTVGYGPQGGALMQKVSLKNGETKEIILGY